MATGHPSPADDINISDEERLDSEDEFFDANSEGASDASSNPALSETPSRNVFIPDLEHPSADTQLLNLDELVIKTDRASSPKPELMTPQTSFSSLPPNDKLGFNEQSQDPSKPMAPPRRKKHSKDISSNQTDSTSLTQSSDKDGGNSAVPSSPAAPPRSKRGVKSLTSPVKSSGALETVSEDSEMKSPEPVNRPRVPSGSVADIRNRIRRSQTPTDEEILDNVMVTCLDTGESVPMSRLHELLPEGVNPLSFKVIERTGEFSADQESLHEAEGVNEEGRISIKKTLKNAKDKTIAAASKASVAAKALGDKVVDAIRRDDERIREEQEREEEEAGFIKMRTRSAKAQHLDGLRHLKCVQDLSNTHIGAIWTMKISTCGRLMATAGQDKTVRVWVVKTSYDYFKGVRTAQSKDNAGPAKENSSSTPDHKMALFHPEPFCEYSGHTADVLDLAWCHSKNFFLLTSSMDKTVRLWHVSRGECLASFLHEDFVTAIAFHPRNDKYFLSGSLDCKLRLWNIPEKKVALWNEVGSEGCNLITSANFCSGGKYAVAGTYDGRCVFFNTEERLKYHTQIHARSNRGKNSKGRKISGIEPMPGSDKILVSSNDSRVRLFDLKDHSLSCKYKGAVNTSSQIKATFSPDGTSIICGSEDHQFYTWDTEPTPLNPSAGRKKSWRRDRNDDYQRFSAHQAVVTVAMYAPPNVDSKQTREYVLSADYSGAIKVYVSQRSGPVETNSTSAISARTAQSSSTKP